MYTPQKSAFTYRIRTKLMHIICILYIYIYILVTTHTNNYIYHYAANNLSYFFIDILYYKPLYVRIQATKPTRKSHHTLINPPKFDGYYMYHRV
jgi:hypothetical protein